MCDAPSQVLQELEAIPPPVIHNDAPRTLSDLLKLMHSIDLFALRSRGVEVNRIGPRRTATSQLVWAPTSLPRRRGSRLRTATTSA